MRSIRSKFSGLPLPHFLLPAPLEEEKEEEGEEEEEELIKGVRFRKNRRGACKNKEALLFRASWMEGQNNCLGCGWVDRNWHAFNVLNVT